MNWPIFKLNEDLFTFHLQYKHFGTFVSRKREKLLTQKIRKYVTPF